MSGQILFNKSNAVYVYVGKVGNDAVYDSVCKLSGTSFNGGGSGTADAAPNDGGGSGGGATDIRLTSGSWDVASSLNSRIMVAGGGAGGGVIHPAGSADAVRRTGSGGGLTGVGTVWHWQDVQASNSSGYMGTQTSGNKFGIGANGGCGGEGGAGAGGGYYGGKNYYEGSNYGSSGGGSSYISGHTGSVAIASGSTAEPRAVRVSGCTTGTTNNNCSIHYSGKTFSNTVMIDGLGYKWTNTKGALQAMPKPAGGTYASGTGHTGNGYAKITWLGDTI